MKKSLFKVIKFSFVLLILGLVVCWYLLSDLNKMYDSKGFTFLKKEINKTKNENLSDIIDIYKKTHLIQNTEKNIYGIGKTENIKKTCPSYELVQNYGFNVLYHNNSTIKSILFSKKLEQDFTQEECLKFLFLKNDYLNGNVGIKEGAKFFFKKTLKELNIEEKITLILMLENPSLYNPIKERKILKKKIIEYEKILEK